MIGLKLEFDCLFLTTEQNMLLCKLSAAMLSKTGRLQPKINVER